MAFFTNLFRNIAAVIDPANNRLLLSKLSGVPKEKRTGRFVCTIAMVDADGKELALVRGTVEGRILTPEETSDPKEAHRGRGLHGFGYDPLFLITEQGRTTAEMEESQKNAISHRGRAARVLWGKMK